MQSSVGFLTREDIERLTGYAVGEKKKQRDWLTQHGYIYSVNARGENVVLWEHVREKLCNLRLEAETRGPDLSAAFAGKRGSRRSAA